MDIDRIKSDFSHASRRRCSESGCTLRLDGLSDHVVLKGEEICQDRKVCDCIIFVVGSPVVIGIVELKSRTVHSSEIVDKLTNGSEIALDVLEKCIGRQIKFEFYHLLLSQRLDPAERRKIERERSESEEEGENTTS